MSSDAPRFTHIDAEGRVAMVDVSHKIVTGREAKAGGFIRLAEATLRLISEDGIKKGNVLATARLAGIQAAKQTALLVPLCHQVPLSHVEIAFELASEGISISATARTRAATGVEMEALTAVSMAAITIYDMCKAVDKHMEITDIRLLEKRKDL